jgi:antirestriction protein ArdC
VGSGRGAWVTSQRWLTYRQAEQAGGHVRRGEKGTVICYADRFTSRDEADKAQSEDREARTVAFLKRFTVFNLDQCDGLPDVLTGVSLPIEPVVAIAAADRIIEASEADVRIG